MAEMRLDNRSADDSGLAPARAEEGANVRVLRAAPENRDRKGVGNRSKRLRRVLLLLGPLVVIAGALFLYLSGGRYVSTDNAYVKADELAIATDVSGIVADIAVHDNQKVEKGQVLFRLDDEPYRIALAGAEAQLATTRNEIATLQATYRQNLAQVEQAKTDAGFYQATYQRQQDLVQRGVASQSAFDQAQRDLDVARERILVSQRQAEATLAQLGGTADEPVENNPPYRQVQADVDRARRDLRRTVVTAPIAGIVTNVDALQVGAYLPAAQSAFNLVAADRVWIEANPKETDLTWLKVGDKAQVTIDSYPDRDWQGTVVSVSPASGAEFSVLPAQNASGNWVKVVQRIPIRIGVDVPAEAPMLRAGMSANVDIDTGHERHLGDLVGSVLQLIGL
jgi:membrane fusion protein (multidrug efflux system)